MIKIPALKPVTAENMGIVADTLTKRSQNIRIDYSQYADLVSHAVEILVYRMLQVGAYVRDFRNALRVLYASKREDFYLSMCGLSKEARTSMNDLKMKGEEDNGLYNVG